MCFSVDWLSLQLTTIFSFYQIISGFFCEITTKKNSHYIIKTQNTCYFWACNPALVMVWHCFPRFRSCTCGSLAPIGETVQGGDGGPHGGAGGGKGCRALASFHRTALWKKLAQLYDCYFVTQHVNVTRAGNSWGVARVSEVHVY